MNTQPFSFPADLPPPLALALFKVLQELTDALWQQYETQLVELIMEELDQCPASQYNLDFDDNLPF